MCMWGRRDASCVKREEREQKAGFTFYVLRFTFYAQDHMNLQMLKTQIRSGAIDTVVVALPDPFGRLVGKRFRADVFLDSVARHGTHGCNYLLTVNIEMDPLDGFKVANWEAGFGDFLLRPDPETYRIIPWQ